MPQQELRNDQQASSRSAQAVWPGSQLSWPISLKATTVVWRLCMCWIAVGVLSADEQTLCLLYWRKPVLLGGLVVEVRAVRRRVPSLHSSLPEKADGSPLVLTAAAVAISIGH